MSDRIRLATAEDAAILAEIYAPAVLERPTSFELTVPDPTEMARRVAAIQQRTPWLVYKAAGQVLGYAYASAHRDRPAYQWSVEVSAYVAPAAQRRGVARKLYTALFQVLTLQGFQNAYAGITLPNLASEGFHQAMGFKLVGVYHGVGFKIDRWHDVAWFERALGPRPVPPTSPVALPEIRITPAFEAALQTHTTWSAV